MFKKFTVSVGVSEPHGYDSATELVWDFKVDARDAEEAVQTTRRCLDIPALAAINDFRISALDEGDVVTGKPKTTPVPKKIGFTCLAPTTPYVRLFAGEMPLSDRGKFVGFAACQTRASVIEVICERPGFARSVS